MESYDENGDSLPYIDDFPDNNFNQYNLKIIENYQNKNRNIEISDQVPDGVECKSLSPVAPLAEDNEFTDSQEENVCHHVQRLVPKQTGMKLVIRGCNSVISIQGLDNKSSITFKRKGEKFREQNEQRKEKPTGGFFNKTTENKPGEKPRKGRWKMLTRSLISKSARFERRGLDERYPKYVLLKNEEEIAKEEESYPKMIMLNEKTKPEFSFRKSFKNRTKPMDVIETEPKVEKKQKKPLTERNLDENRNAVAKKKATAGRSKRLPPEKLHGDESDVMYKVAEPSPQVFNEIQGIFEDTLKLCSGEKQQGQEEYYGSVPPPFCSFSCHDPCCYQHPPNQPPVYMPVYPPYNKPRHSYKHINTQTSENEFESFNEEQGNSMKEQQSDFPNLSFGLLSGFFPRVVIMKAYQEGEDDGEVIKENEFLGPPPPPPLPQSGDATQPKPDSVKTLEVPQPDLTVKSKMVFEEPEPDKPFFPGDVYVNRLTLNEVSSSDEDPKTKTDDSETTEYLHYCETATPDNDSVKPGECKENGREDDETPKNLTLTKIGYKMYDNLTKLSLNREREIIEKAETKGCGCDGNGTKKSPCNITLESDDRIVKVTVPENELNFQIVNSGGTDIQIGVTGRSAAEEDKKLVRKGELWHEDTEGRGLLVAKSEKWSSETDTKGSQTIRLSLADDREVVVSIGSDGEKKKRKEKDKEKSTKEAKVGTDDYNLAGGDFICTLDGSHRSLSPRTGQLLRNLQQKLELGEKERKFLTEKINQAFTDQKYQSKILPGVFLVQQITPRASPPKNSLKAPSLKSEKKDVAGQLREYYCEECLATMRIFEDENPSVKSMVDKYETIIQLESY